LIPVICENSSTVRCCAEPSPEDEKNNSFGRALAKAINSLTLL